MVRFKLPWPPKELSPNARVHWGARAKKVKMARWAAKVLAIKARAKGHEVRFFFAPPDGRRRDLDNMIAANKAYQDGIADALSVDDSALRTSHEILPPEKGGAVYVEVT